MITIHELYSIYLEHPTVSTDSRRIEAGSIFFALRGDRFDGNAYALEALTQGAAYAVVDDPGLPEHPQLLRVADSLTALQELAALHRATLSLPVIAITGTNGKTTTKELAAAVLSHSYNLLYTEGNLNNHIGVPLTLLRMRAEHQLVLIEMGASKPGDIEELCVIAQPNYGIITNVGKAHLEGFGSIEGVAATKGELYDWLREHGGKVIRKEEDTLLAEIGAGIPTVSYGQSEQAVVRGYLSTSGSSMFLEFDWEATAIGLERRHQQTQLVGAYNIDNALAAIALGLFLDVPAEAIGDAIASYHPSNSRSQLIESQHNVIIADAYNANPSSMRMALDNFCAITSPRPRLIILGDMNELGEASGYAHRELLDRLRPLADTGTEVYLCGPIWVEIASGVLPTFADTSALMAYLEEHRPEGRLILVKGSNGIGLGRIIPQL